MEYHSVGCALKGKPKIQLFYSQEVPQLGDPVVLTNLLFRNTDRMETVVLANGDRHTAAPFTTLPCVDLRQLKRARKVFNADLIHACSTCGTFSVDGSGIGRKTTDLFSAARHFFALPDSSKRKAAIDKSPHFRGWARLENGTEVMELGPEEAKLEVSTAAAPEFRLRGPNQWPNEAECPGFRNATSDFCDSVHHVG